MFKLAAEKNLNKYLFPVFSIKGRPITYPVSLKYGNREIFCHKGMFDAKSWMMMDILETFMIQNTYNRNEDKTRVVFRHKIPTPNNGMVKKTSGFCISSKMIKHVLPKMIATRDFQEESKYNVVEPIIRWLPGDVQIKVIQAIPEEHQPIFWWLKYHLRRPSEAMALHRIDYLRDQDAFHIRRTFSAKELITQTKTKREHVIPCHSEFRKIMERIPVRMDSPFFFVNPRGKLAGKHYTHCVMRVLWNDACRKVGVEIEMYSSLKHSSCSQFVNEKGYSIDEVQMMTDHARRDSVRRYASVQLEAKRRLLEGKVVDINWKIIEE